MIILILITGFSMYQSYKLLHQNQLIQCNGEFSLNNNNTLKSFSYYGLEEYVKVGAISFCMNEMLESVEKYSMNEIIVHNECIKISELIIKEIDCIKISSKAINKQNYMSEAIVESILLSMPVLKLSRAVIVEPRNHIALPYTIDNVCNILNIPITLFHGNNNKELAERLLHRNSSCINQLVNLHVDNLDGDTYNHLLLSDDMFWSKINATDNESLLIFQTDSGICNNKNTLINIEIFQNYHYCGGLFHDLHIINTTLVGNGGLSIRHKGMMRKLLEYNIDHRHHFYWEDILFSFWCIKDPNCLICPEDISQLFVDSGTNFTNPIIYQIDNDFISLHKHNIINNVSNDNNNNNLELNNKIIKHTTSLGFHNNWIWNNIENNFNCSVILSTIQQMEDKYLLDYFNKDLLICPFNIQIMKLNLLNNCGLYFIDFIT